MKVKKSHDIVQHWKKLQRNMGFHQQFLTGSAPQGSATGASGGPAGGALHPTTAVIEGHPLTHFPWKYYYHRK
jgi:hypothetical protein